MPWGATHLDRRPAGIEEVAAQSIGLYVSPPVSHLELAARVPGYRAADLERLMDERRLIGLRTLRGSAFLMPTSLLPVVVPATRDRNVKAFGSYLRKNLSGTYEDWADRVLDAIPLGGSATKAEITARLEPSEADRPFMSNLVSQMVTDSRLIGVRLPVSWRSARTAFTRWDDWLPDVDVISPDRDEMRVELARLYLEAFGPATVADFAWWSGLTKAQAAAAFEGADAVPEGNLFDLGAGGGDPPLAVRLLPIWDTLFVTWKDRSRFLPDELYPFIYDASGNATSVVLINGRVAGVWGMDADEDPIEIRVAGFDPFTPVELSAIESEAQVVAVLAGVEEARVIETGEPPNLVEGKRNLFMRPV